MAMARRLVRIPTQGARSVPSLAQYNFGPSATELPKLNRHWYITSQEGLLESGRRRKKGGRRRKKEFYSANKYLWCSWHVQPSPRPQQHTVNKTKIHALQWENTDQLIKQTFKNLVWMIIEQRRSWKGKGLERDIRSVVWDMLSWRSLLGIGGAIK